MKNTPLLTLLSTAALTAVVCAGERTVDTSKQIAPPPPPPVYGTGAYVGIQAGINAYQDFGGTRRFSLGDSEISLEPREKVGFAGGGKIGYVFGTGTVRPAVEADLFYNGVNADVDARVNGHDAKFNAEGTFHTGAFMGNFLVRFAFDRFQPYIGGGLGGYYADRQDTEVTLGHRHVTLETTSNGGFAWQLIAGADYYFTEKLSTFLEYKFLNYEDAGLNGDRVGQQLVLLGLRVHF